MAVRDGCHLFFCVGFRQGVTIENGNSFLKKVPFFFTGTIEFRLCAYIVRFE